MKKTMILLALALLIASSMAFAEGDKVFSDLSESHWARGHIEDLFGREIISGYPDGTFKPEDNVRVNEFLAMTLRGIGYHLESKSSDWSKPYVDKAIELGVIEDKEFPQYTAFITREQMASVIVNTIALKDLKLPSSTDAYVIRNMKDYHLVEDYYKQNVIESYKAGIITGYPDGTFRPEGLATRAEASKVLINFLNPSSRTPYKNEDAKKVVFEVEYSADKDGNEVDSYDPKDPSFSRQKRMVEIYAPIRNEEPVNEIIEVITLLRDFESITDSNYTDLSYNSFSSIIGSGGYKSKEYLDSIQELPVSDMEKGFIAAERLDYSFSVDLAKLNRDLSPYKMVYWKKSSNMLPETSFKNYFNKTHREKLETTFKVIFEEDFEEFWAAFENAIFYTGQERKSEDLEIGNRDIHFRYDSGGLTLYISLKK